MSQVLLSWTPLTEFDIAFTYIQDEEWGRGSHSVLVNYQSLLSNFQYPP